MLMRVPKVFQASGLMELNREGLAAFEAGYPVRIAEKLPCIFSDSLRNKVSNWPTKAVGTKNPSWVIQDNQLKPGALSQAVEAGDFLVFLGDFYHLALSAMETVLGLEGASLGPDRVTWRPYELATMPRRWNARDDLFHLDSFPSRPAQGRRVLRLFYNASPTDSVVWSHTLNLNAYIQRYFNSSDSSSRGDKPEGFGDPLMAQIHDQMKLNEEFQETAPRILHSFAPGEAWIALTDICLHSFLRGEWLMDVSWFVSAPWLVQSPWSPKACFDRWVNAQPKLATNVKQAA